MNVILDEGMKLENVNRLSNWILEKKNTCVISDDSNLFLQLIIQNALDFEFNFKMKENPSIRTRVLIITRDNSMVESLQNISINTNQIIEYSNQYGKHLRDKGVFCDIDSKKFSFVYWNYYLRLYFNDNIPSEIPLNYVFPIAKGRKDFHTFSRGERNKFGRYDNSLPPFFVFSDVLSTAYDKELNFDYIFIDGASIKKQISHSSLTSPSLIFFDNSFDFRLPYVLNHETKLFSFESIQSEKIRIKCVDAEFDETLEIAFDKSQKLKSKGFSNIDLKVIIKILHNVIRTCLDGVEYDFLAKYDSKFDRIKDLLDELKESDNRFSDQDFEDVIKLIEDIYNKHNLDSSCPKYDKIEELLDSLLARGEKILIIVSSKIDSLGLKEKLSRKLRKDINELNDIGIEIVTFSNSLKMEIMDFDHVLVTSAIRFSDLVVLSKKLGRRVTVILYQLELRELKSKLLQLSSHENSLFSLGLSNDKELIYKKIYSKLKNADTRGKNVQLDIELSKFLEAIESGTIDYSVRLHKSYKGENATKVILASFEDGSRMFLRPGALVQFRDISNKKIEKKYVRELKNKNEIILIDGDAREDLYKIFIQSVNRKSNTLRHYEVIQKWRHLYEDKFIFLKLDDNQLFERMKKKGWNKTTQGILKNWRSGYSFGPRDKKDIKVLGEALGIKEFIVEIDFYYNSMRYIRGERRATAKLLNKIIYYSNHKINVEDSVLLERYNLTLDEVKEAITIKKVRNISENFYFVKPSEIGLLF
ncbi:DISARM system-associated protein DrmE [Heyndrickxia sp. FSL K6-6286]|uniref:DISARM system-associated protein DrmE n=1 Tax=Heyndrickxia sp. FSL K6-6286 TaxID=2921510 RepID=UPI0031599F60